LFSFRLFEWTRLQPIRTIAEIDLEFTAFTSEPFQYQRFSRKIKQMKDLGMKSSEIARSLGLEPKTVKRALSWIKEID